MMTTMELDNDALATRDLIDDVLWTKESGNDAVATPGLLLQGDTATTPLFDLGVLLQSRLQPSTTMTTTQRR